MPANHANSLEAGSQNLTNTVSFWTIRHQENFMMEATVKKHTVTDELFDATIAVLPSVLHRYLGSEETVPKLRDDGKGMSRTLAPGVAHVLVTPGDSELIG